MLRSAYAIASHVAVNKWDSALQFYDPMANSGYAAGAFAPRIIALFNHESLGNAVAEQRAYQFMSAADATAFLGVFPELVQRPVPAATAEVVSTLALPDPPIDVEVLLHEFGHGVDTFLAPGIARDHVPACMGANCDMECDEDDTDEAWPLDETVAQMVSLWMVRRMFPELPHERCDLLDFFVGGATENQHIVHSPACLGAQDQLNIFIRDDDPACPDPALCDKPDEAAVDPDYGGPWSCLTTPGYNTFSVLQAWWNTLNGLYCDPAPPFACQDFAPEWPLGCGGGDAAPECVTPDEAAGLALVYALRTNALSYVEFFDAMSRFVACNYGPDAYIMFNQALCDHGIRACNAPLPLDCETCGNNGIREGGENCDGLDLTVDEVGGGVVQCSDFPGYAGGTLACDPMCEFDLTDCEPAAADETTAGDEGSGGGSGSSADGGQVGEDGCACTAGGGDDIWEAWLLSILWLAMRRRRFVGAAALSLSSFGCGPSDDGSATTPSSPTTESDESSTGPDAVEGWPDRWYGQYYDTDTVNLGVASPSEPYFHYFRNISLGPGLVRLDYFNASGEDTGTVTFEPQVGADGLAILPVEGEDHIEWPPAAEGRASVDIRPGSDCSVLESEMRFTASEETFSSTLRRGRICLIVPCDPDQGINCNVTVDLCTDDPAPTTCDPA